ncbi:alpha/beta hydrolase [Pendulispora albinea]|uniref:Alpha/beta hydrolase n=1 Tax=Pendulispora albinea TaxID=2741071 RepID=A0ABZ2M1K5_9BACT
MSTAEAKEEIARREIAAVLADIDAHPWPTEIAEARVLYDQMGPPVAADIRIDTFEIAGRRASFSIPPVAESDRAVFFLHGGGYAYGSLESHAGMAAELARASKCVVLSLQYRLAPEHPFPAALDDATAAYEWLLNRGFKPEKIAFVGDSAGGGLVMSTLVTLKAKNRPLPGATVAISPWVDLEHEGESWTTRQKLDPMLDRPLVDLLSANYLKGQPRPHPVVTTVNADLRGMPPMLIQVGEREVLFSDADRLAKKARADGVEVIFEEWPEMVHVWHLYFHMLGAGREAITRVGDFIYAKTGSGAKANGNGG